MPTLTHHITQETRPVVFSEVSNSPADSRYHIKWGRDVIGVATHRKAHPRTWSATATMLFDDAEADTINHLHDKDGVIEFLASKTGIWCDITAQPVNVLDPALPCRHALDTTITTMQHSTDVGLALREKLSAHGMKPRDINVTLNILSEVLSS